ncbi:MAG TPA: glycosyl hydrolase family 18 protein, partial [Draconibacterium sp.]|nr:glycosyl hydrolase family 18 protein [Draconibacterium sp.]
SNGNLKINGFASVINKAKEDNPDIIVLISLGGGVLSPAQMQTWANFIDIPANRPVMISEIIDFVELHQLDGVDFDLEWDAVTAGYSDFVIQLSDSLKKYNKLFTAALPATTRYSKITNNALQAFDFINIMAYDKTGPWAPNNPGQHSSFDFARQAVTFWKNQGVASNKLQLGVPFYGYNFGDTENVTEFSYSEMVNKNILYADLDQVGEAYYNGRPTIEMKVELAAENVDGIMIWELGQDKYNEYSLLSSIHNKFNTLGITTTGLCGNTVLAGNLKELTLKIYPNPASENLYIELNTEKQFKVSLYDILGQKLNLFPQKQFNKLILNVSGLKKGIYLLKVEGKGFSQTRKIVIDNNSQ